jgi:hypothetical protein
MSQLHEDTKKMLDIIRSKQALNEQAETPQEDKELDPAELTEEERKFRESVSPRVKFNRFKLYPKAQNVEFSGVFTDNNVEWFYSLDDPRGVYITAEMMRLSDEDLKKVQKLVAYYQTWADEWATRIAEEYKNEEAELVDQEEGPESLESPEYGEVETEEEFDQTEGEGI